MRITINTRERVLIIGTRRSHGILDIKRAMKKITRTRYKRCLVSNDISLIIIGKMWNSVETIFHRTMRLIKTT